MSARFDLAGQRFGRWEVLRLADPVKRRTMWLCRCDCGTYGTVCMNSLRRQISRSCGCMRLELTRIRMKKLMTIHGQSRTLLYKIWAAMRRRCSNPRASNYKNYGGRGITVCKEWESFEVFAADMGPRPTSRHSLDRKHNDGNYEPGNVMWATQLEQRNNTRTNHLITLDGQTKTCAEWARERNLSYSTVRNRILRDGWDPSRALSVSPEKYRGRKRGN